MTGKGSALLIGVVTAVALHLVLGWAWTIGAAVLAGYLAHRGGWWIGFMTLLFGWGSLFFVFAVLDRASVVATMDVMGGILGGLPGVFVVIAPLLIASILGILGGAAGSALSMLRNGEQPPRRFRSARFRAKRHSPSWGR